MDTSSSRGQDLTHCPCPRRRGWHPGSSVGRCVSDAHAKATGAQVRARGRELRPHGRRVSAVLVGTGCRQEAPGSRQLGSCRSQFHRPRGAWPSGSSKGFYTLCLSWREVGRGAFCTLGLFLGSSEGPLCWGH